jgi:hypothetical protein
VVYVYGFEYLSQLRIWSTGKFPEALEGKSNFKGNIPSMSMASSTSANLGFGVQTSSLRLSKGNVTSKAIVHIYGFECHSQLMIGVQTSSLRLSKGKVTSKTKPTYPP